MEQDRLRSYTPAIVLTVCLFFLWGMANNLNDILIAQFKKAFTLTDFQTSFVQQAFYLGYFVVAIPAALVARSRGYKTAIVIGLLLYALGALLFYPAAHFGEYVYFLAALFVIASGLAFLETSANPLMTEMGDPRSAARRLNWAQAANPIGTITGVLVGKYLILSEIAHDEKTLDAMQPAAREAFYRAEIIAVQGPYLALGLIVLGFAVAAALIRFPHDRAGPAAGEPQAPFMDIFGQRRLLAATVAQFFYIGAQVGLWSYTIRYAQVAMPGISERAAADYLFASLVLFGIGRFVGVALMGRIAPVRLLAIFAGIGLVLTLFAALVGGHIGILALVCVSLFMSIQFPTIFALGVEGLGPLRRAGASLLVMAIIGGAVLTGVMGWISDRSSIALAMLVPAVCFAVIASFALRLTGQPAPESVMPA